MPRDQTVFTAASLRVDEVPCKDADIQDKGSGKNAIVILKAAGIDTSNREGLVETTRP